MGKCSLEIGHFWTRETLFVGYMKSHEQSVAVRQKPLTTAQLADHLTVTPRTIQNWRDARKIPFLRITARSFRYDLDQVERALSK
jgi:excisionase family DNA binding protein